MKRIIILLLSCIPLLTGCSAVSADIATIEEAAVVETASVIPVETFGTEKDGYCLTETRKWMAEIGHQQHIVTKDGDTILDI